MWVGRGSHLSAIFWMASLQVTQTQCYSEPLLCLRQTSEGTQAIRLDLRIDDVENPGEQILLALGRCSCHCPQPQVLAGWPLLRAQVQAGKGQGATGGYGTGCSAFLPGHGHASPSNLSARANQFSTLGRKPLCRVRLHLPNEHSYNCCAFSPK
jgi:hypothetical protein